MMPIRMLVMDVDGTLTDGRIYMGPQGEAMKGFHAQDGMGIVLARESGIIPVILTSRHSAIVANRAAELSIPEVHQGVKDKLPALEALVERCGLSFENVAYIGDDVNDLPCMQRCGLVGCPADAVDEVLRQADCVTKRRGGEGAVREFIVQIFSINAKTAED